MSQNSYLATRSWRRRVGVVVGLVMVVSVACGDDGDGGAAGGESRDAEIILGWLAQSSRGGFFAAQQQGYYEEAGLDVTLEPGIEVSAVQLVGNGQAEFGLAEAEEIIDAREEGIPVVALATTFQTSPRVILYHESNPVGSVEDLEGRTLYLDLGDLWWEWVKREFELENVQELAYPGQLAPFIEDDNALIQDFVGNNETVLAREGIEAGSLFVGDYGFNPYTNVLFTREQLIEENEDLVRDFVEASVRGWEYYETNSEDVSEYIHSFNEELAVEDINTIADLERDIIFGGDAAEHGFGYMTEERWAEMEEQLRSIGEISEEIDVSEVYTTEFLP